MVYKLMHKVDIIFLWKKYDLMHILNCLRDVYIFWMNFFYYGWFIDILVYILNSSCMHILIAHVISWWFTYAYFDEYFEWFTEGWWLWYFFMRIDNSTI